jgi:hypothetical protein
MSELTDKVRDKYPGVYDHIPDNELEDKVLSKYPEYAKLASGDSRLRAAFSGGVKNAEAGAEARANAPDTRPLPFDPAAFAPAGTGVQPTSPAAENRDPTGSEMVAGLGAAALPLAPAAPALVGAAMSPAGQATIGGVEGFRRGGIRGGLIGAVTGGTLGKLLKVANMLQAAKAAVPAVEAATETAPAVAPAVAGAGKAAFQEGSAKLAQMLGQEVPTAAESAASQLPAQAQRLKQLFEVLGKEGLKRSGLTDAEVAQFLELLKQTKGLGGTRLP